MYSCTVATPTGETTTTTHASPAALLLAVLPTLPKLGTPCTVHIGGPEGSCEASDETEDCDNPETPVYVGAGANEDGYSFATWEGALLFALAHVCAEWKPGY